MKILLVNADGRLHDLPGVKSHFFTLPARSFKLPEGVRISIHDERPYNPDTEDVRIIGTKGGFANITSHPSYLYANPGGRGFDPGKILIEILAITVPEAYELLDAVDKSIGTKLVVLHPLTARAWDFWGRLWGYALERLESRIRGEKAIHRQVTKYQKRVQHAIDRHKDGSEPLTHEHILELGNELVRLINRVEDTQFRPQLPEVHELQKLADETKPPVQLGQIEPMLGSRG